MSNMTSAMTKINSFIVVLLLLVLITASAASQESSIHVSSYGKIVIPFGKTTPGDDIWYCDTSSMGDRKVGTIYNNPQAYDFNTLFARFSNWPGWDASYPKVKAGIIDSGGNLLDMSINEIMLQPVIQFEHLWHAFRLSKNLTLSPGDYCLCLWIGGYGAIAYRCSQSENPASFIIQEDYNNPTGIIGNLTIQRNFDIFAVYTESNIPPRAIMEIITSVTTEVGSIVTFDGSLSLPGFYDNNETQILSYEWDFGDGTTDTGAKVEKNYSSVGEYRVTLRVTDSQGLQDTETTRVWVKPVGGYTSFIADFENDGDFSVGVEHSGNYKYWDRERWFMDIHPDAYRFWPETTIVRSGTRSAKLELLDPISDGRRRLQRYHDWNPFTEHIWQEEWFYLPEDLLWTNPDTGEGLWYALHTIISERMWNPDILPWNFQDFAIAINVIWDQYHNNPVFDFILRGRDVDNNDDGQPDIGDFEKYFELGSEGVPTGRWIKIRSHIYRNLQNWDEGYVEFWIEDSETTETIYHKEDPCRTIGIDPERIASLTPWKQGDYMAYIASGFCLYAGGLRGGMPLPCKIYVDDFQVETTPVE